MIRIHSIIFFSGFPRELGHRQIQHCPIRLSEKNLGQAIFVEYSSNFFWLILEFARVPKNPIRGNTNMHTSVGKAKDFCLSLSY